MLHLVLVDQAVLVLHQTSQAHLLFELVAVVAQAPPSNKDRAELVAVVLGQDIIRPVLLLLLVQLIQVVAAEAPRTVMVELAKLR